MQSHLIPWKRAELHFRLKRFKSHSGTITVNLHHTLAIHLYTVNN